MNVEAVLVILVGFALYLIHSFYRPYANCWRCGGKPRNSSRRGGSWRLCRWCGGKGQRVRPGRRLYEKLNPKASRK